MCSSETFESTSPLDLRPPVCLLLCLLLLLIQAVLICNLLPAKYRSSLNSTLPFKCAFLHRLAVLHERVIRNADLQVLQIEMPYISQMGRKQHNKSQVDRLGGSQLGNLLLFLWVNLCWDQGLCSVVYTGLHFLQRILQIIPDSDNKCLGSTSHMVLQSSDSETH